MFVVPRVRVNDQSSRMPKAVNERTIHSRMFDDKLNLNTVRYVMSTNLDQIDRAYDSCC